MTPQQLLSLRQAFSLTQQAYADKLGVSIRTYKRWESPKGYSSFGERKFGPSASGIELIASLNPSLK